VSCRRCRKGHRILGEFNPSLESVPKDSSFFMREKLLQGEKSETCIPTLMSRLMKPAGLNATAFMNGAHSTPLNTGLEEI